MPTSITWIGAILAIVMVDLTLSGDNALVIGAAASQLDPINRRRAIVIGGGAAIILRISLTFIAVFLLQIPFLKIIGGIAVFIIAMFLLQDENGENEVKEIRAHRSLLRACTAIIVADLSMSLDNVLSIAALAHGNYLLLAIGLLLSVVLLMVASSVIAGIMARFPWLLYLAGGILAWVASTMIVDDNVAHPLFSRLDQLVPGPLTIYFSLLVLALFGVWALHIYQSTQQRTSQAAQLKYRSPAADTQE
jgi:YjbE family integral membrane protein